MGLLNCGDTRNYLKKYGFGTIALPRASIKPLLMLTRSGGTLTPLGPLAGTFTPGAVPLPVSQRGPSAPLTGAKSSNLDASIGLDILGKVIGALAGSALGVKAAYKRARNVEFEFGEVTEDQVPITELDQFLGDASIAGNIGPFLEQLLEDDEVYVIVSALDAREISVDATDDQNASLGLDIPVIQQMVGGKIQVSGGGASSSTITYKSTETPLTFGVKVVRLGFDQGRYTTMKIVDAKKAFVAAAMVHNKADAPGETAIIVPDATIEL